ncbi:alphaK I4 [Puccinia sorghi]|uniref:AlphaK I4 n=1 Tax=Puccinia sorghi TaxID=27349 RepID=A0A0L6UDW7_9BASI|nr:alphaK I4 [Puccinia sorghi]
MAKEKHRNIKGSSTHNPYGLKLGLSNSDEGARDRGKKGFGPFLERLSGSARNLTLDPLLQWWREFNSQTKISLKILRLRSGMFLLKRCLSQGKYCLISQEDPFYALQRSTEKKPAQIYLTYQHPEFENREDHQSISLIFLFQMPHTCFVEKSSHKTKTIILMHCSRPTREKWD